MIGRGFRWLFSTRQLPYITAALMAISLLTGGFTLVLSARQSALAAKQSALAARQTAYQAAQIVVIQGRCGELRRALDPVAPPPSTPLGKYNAVGNRAEYDRLHCSAVPPLAPEPTPAP